MAFKLLETFVEISVRGTKDVDRAFRREEQRWDEAEKKNQKVATSYEKSSKRAAGAVDKITKSVANLNGATDKLSKKKTTLKVGLEGNKQVEAGLDAIERRSDRLQRGRITLTTTLAGAGGVIADLEAIEGVSTRVDGDRVIITADVDGSAESQARLRQLQSTASRIDGDEIRLDVDVEGTASAIAELTALNRAKAAINNENVSLKVDRGPLAALDALGSAIDGVATRIRSLQVVSRTVAIPSLIGAIGAIPAIASAAAMAVGALATAIGSGLVGALVAGGGAAGAFVGAIGLIAAPFAMLFNRLGEYGKSVDKVSSAQKSAASSAQSYQQAQQGVARAQEQANEQVASAVEAYQSSLRGVEDAERGLEDARDQLTDSTRELRAAQQELNRAMEDEPLNQKEATLDLADAQDRASDAQREYNEAVSEYGANSEEATDAMRSLERANLDLERTERDVQRTREEGSDQLNSAKEGVRSASKAEQDARDGVADAERALQDARQESAKAYAGIAKAQQEGARQVADAQAQAAEAMRALQEAESGVLAEMIPLTAAQKRLYDEYERFKGIATAAFTPAMDAAARLGVMVLRLGGSYMPQFGRASLATMGGLTRAFVDFRTQLSGPVEQAGITRLLATIPRFTQIAATGVGRLTLALFNMFSRALVYAVPLAQAFTDLNTRFLAFTRSTEGQQQMDSYFAYAVMRAKELLQAIVNLGAGFIGLGGAFRESGLVDQVWGGFLRLTEQFRNLTKEGTASREMVVEFGRDSQPILSALWSLVEALVVQWFRVSSAVMNMRNEAGKLVLPQALKDMEGALASIGDLLIAAFRNFGPLLGPAIQGIAELLKYYVALNPVLKAGAEILVGLLQWFSNLSDGTKKLLVSVVSLRLAFAVFGPALMFLLNPFGLLTSGVGLLATRFGGLRGAATALVAGLRAVATAGLTFLLSPVGLVVVGIAALAAGLVLAYRNIEPFRNAVNSVVEVFRNFGRIIGGVLSGDLEKARAAFAALPNWLKPLGRYLGESAMRLRSLGQVFKNTFTVIKGLLSGDTGTEKFRQAFASLPGPVQTALKLIVIGFRSLRTTVGPILTQVGNLIRTGLVAAFNFLRQQGTALANWWRTTWPQMRMVIMPVLQVIGNIIRTVLVGAFRFALQNARIFSTWWKANLPLIRSVAASAFNGARTVVTTVMRVIGTIIRTVFGAAVAFWKANSQSILSIARSVWNIIKTVIQTALRVVLGIVRAALQLLSGDWRGAFNTLRSTANTILQAIVTIAKNLLNILWQAFKIALNTVLRIAKSVFTAVKDAIVNRITEAKNRAGELVNGLKTALSNAWDAVKSAADKAWKAVAGFITEPISNAVDKVKGFLNDLIGVVNRVLTAVGLDPIEVSFGGGGSTGGTGSSGGGRGSGGPAQQSARATLTGTNRRLYEFAEGGIADKKRGGISRPNSPKVHEWGEGDYHEAYLTTDPRFRQDNDQYAAWYAGKTGGIYWPADTRKRAEQYLWMANKMARGKKAGNVPLEESGTQFSERRGGRERPLAETIRRTYAEGGLSDDASKAAVATRDWAHQSDGRPYAWGGSWPPTTDCSGWQNVVHLRYGGNANPSGRMPFSATGNMESYVPSASGFQQGTANPGYSVGWVNGGPGGGHTAGSLAWKGGEINTETGGGAGGTMTGGPAWGATNSYFNRVYSSGSPGDIKGGGGGGGGGFSIPNPAQLLFEKMWKNLVKPIVDRVVKPMEDARYVAVKAIGAAARKVPKGIYEWIDEKIPDTIGGGGTGGGEAGPGGGTSGENQELGKEMLSSSGVPGAWTSLQSLWQKESNWDQHAQNPSSGAYGIPQALPGSKMGPAANPPESNPRAQIDWGLGYIADRYGSTDAAWSHSQQVGWYSEGGIANKAQHRVVAEEGAKELIIPLAGRGARIAQDALGIEHFAAGLATTNHKLDGVIAGLKHVGLDVPTRTDIVAGQINRSIETVNGHHGYNANRQHTKTRDIRKDHSGGGR